MKSNAQAVQKLLGCLIALNKNDEAIELVEKHTNNGASDSLRTDLCYFKALAKLNLGKFDEAVDDFKFILQKKPGHELTKKLYFKILIHQTNQKMVEKDWQAISSLLTEALELAAGNPDFQNELLRFKNALPFSCIKAGQRGKAAEIWEDELKKDPADFKLINNLAIQYYWWANSLEKSNSNGGNNPNPEIDTYWKKAIAYLMVFINSDSYWQSFKNEREKLWGMDLSNLDREGIIKNILDERFNKIFTHYLDQFRQSKSETDVSRFEDYIAMYTLERKIIHIWNDILPCLQRNKSKMNHLLTEKMNTLLNENIPVSFTFLQAMDLLNNANEIIIKLKEIEPDNENLAKLKIYLSPDGIGKVLVLAEDRSNSKKAIEEFNKIPKNKFNNFLPKDTVEGGYVYAAALIAKGKELSENDIQEALICWEEAAKYLSKKTNGKSDPSFEKLTKQLKQKMDEDITNIFNKAIKKLQNTAEVNDEIITSLKLAIDITNSISLKELLAAFYCELGFKKISEKTFAKAREYFQSALSIAPDYKQAKEGMATAFNNEALTKEGYDSIRLLEQARKFDPDADLIKKNLAGSYNLKAIDLLKSNPSSDEARRLLRSAIELDPYNEVIKSNLALSYNAEAVKYLNSRTQYDSNYTKIDKCENAISLLNQGLKILLPNFTNEISNALAYYEEWKLNEEMKKFDDVCQTMIRNLWIAQADRRFYRGY